MNHNRTKAGRKAVSSACARTASPSPATSKTNRKLSDGPERNPLIDDLFDELSTHSSAGGIGRLEGQSVSNRGSFADFKGGPRRPSTATSTSMRSGSNIQLRMAVDVVCKTAQHFVHAMRMNELEDYFTPREGNSPEDALHHQLAKRTPQEVESVVQVLVELLEEVRKARAVVAPLTGSFAFPEGRERALSTSMFSTVSTASLMRPPVHETNQLAMAYDQQGNRMINCYTIIASLGQGAFGKVKLGVDASTGQNVAIKIIDKKHLKKKIGGLGAGDQDAALKREIAIMKKVRHRNCVSLYEVIDDPASNKLYLIMDYVPNGPVVRLKPQQFTNVALATIESGALLNGEVYNKYLARCAVRQHTKSGDTPLTPDEIASRPTIYACKPVSQHVCALYLRQLVSGLRYMHKRHLVHHDIKPDNILLGSDHHVFLTDFGVSEILSSRNAEAKDMLKGHFDGSATHNYSENANLDTSAGSLAAEANGGYVGGGGGGPKLGGGTLLFTSPELFDPSVNPSDVDPYLTDVWALGVTLYCMLIGITPFFGETLPEVRRHILTEPYPWNGMNIHEVPLAAEWHTILDGLLEKDPEKRWTLQDLKSFLDGDSFQDKMRVAAMQDAAARAVARATADASSSSAMHSSRLKGVSQAYGPGSPKRAGLDSITSQSHRALSASAAMSVLSMDSANGVNSFFFGFEVSQAEVSQATRAAKVEVTQRRLVVSAYTRARLQRFLERVRQRLRNRNYIQISSVLDPYDGQIGSDSTTSGQMNLDTSKNPGGSNVPSLLLEVPVMSVAGPFHRTSATPTSNAVVHQRGLAHGEPRPTRRQSRAARASCVPGEGNIAHRVRDCGSQSIDAMLSIVNLQSTSNAFSHSFSFASSSDSSLGAAGAPMPAVAETVAATAALSPADTRLSDHTSVDTSTASTRNAPSNSMGETVMWCGNGRPPSTVAHATSEAHSSSPDEQSLRRGNSGNSPLPHGHRRKPRIGHGFLNSATTTTKHHGPSVDNGERVSVTSDSTRKLRDDSPSILTRGASTTVNTVETYPVAPPRRTRLSVGTERMQHRLSTSRAAAPVLSSEEKVPALKRPQLEGVRHRK